jgi:hypothetical protein
MGSTSGSGGGEITHHSPALEQLFERLDPESGLRVLDLGPAARRNLEHYSTFATRVRFVDLLGGGARRDLTILEDEAFALRLAGLLPLDDEAYDLVLSWDRFNYLNETQAALVARHLAAVAAHGAKLHAMIVTTPTMSAEPMRYQIVGPGEIAYFTTSPDVVPAPDLSAARMERWLEPFRVTRSVILRHGVRELLAVSG